MVRLQEAIENTTKTVILVDDEFYFRQAMKQYLSEAEKEYRLVGEAKTEKSV